MPTHNTTGGTNYIVKGLLALIAAGVVAITATTLTTTNLKLTEQAEPAVSAAGSATVYADSTSHTLKVSNNGGAYGALADLTNLNASNLTSGTVPNARFPTNLPAGGINGTDSSLDITGLEPGGSAQVVGGGGDGAGAGGSARVAGGDGGATGNGGPLDLDGGAKGGGGVSGGEVTIGTVGAESVTIGRTGKITTINGFAQLANGRRRRAATQTVTDSTTLTADDTLTVTLLAGRKYSFRVVYYFTTVATSGVKVDMGGGTCTFTSFQGSIEIINLSTGLYGGSGEMTSSTTSGGITVLGVSTKVVIDGGFVVNAAGTFAPRFAQNAETGAAESVIAKVDSHKWVEDMP